MPTPPLLPSVREGRPWDPCTLDIRMSKVQLRVSATYGAPYSKTLSIRVIQLEFTYIHLKSRSNSVSQCISDKSTGVHGQLCQSMPALLHAIINNRLALCHSPVQLTSSSKCSGIQKWSLRLSTGYIACIVYAGQLQFTAATLLTIRHRMHQFAIACIKSPSPTETGI